MNSADLSPGRSRRPCGNERRLAGSSLGNLTARLIFSGSVRGDEKRLKVAAHDQSSYFFDPKLERITQMQRPGQTRKQAPGPQRELHTSQLPYLVVLLAGSDGCRGACC